MLQMMTEAEYGNCKKQKKPLKDVFKLATDLAKKHNNITRSPKPLQNKFTRIKQKYSAYITKISKSGRDGDDQDLFDKPEFFEEVHEREHGKARQNLQAVFDWELGSNKVDSTPSSSRKRKRQTHASVVQSFLEDVKPFQQGLLEEMKKSNEEKAKISAIMERLVDKIWTCSTNFWIT